MVSTRTYKFAATDPAADPAAGQWRSFNDLFTGGVHYFDAVDDDGNDSGELFDGWAPGEIVIIALEGAPIAGFGYYTVGSPTPVVEHTDGDFGVVLGYGTGAATPVAGNRYTVVNSTRINAVCLLVGDSTGGKRYDINVVGNTFGETNGQHMSVYLNRETGQDVSFATVSIDSNVFVDPFYGNPDQLSVTAFRQIVIYDGGTGDVGGGHDIDLKFTNNFVYLATHTVTGFTAGLDIQVRDAVITGNYFRYMYHALIVTEARDIVLDNNVSSDQIGIEQQYMVTAITGQALVGNNRWADQIMRRSVSVRDYGARGNGVTDATAGVIGAITVVAALGGGEVYFPAGTYLVTSVITVPASVRLVGAGQGTSEPDFKPDGVGVSVIKLSNSSAYLHFKSSTAANELLGCGIENIQIDATGQPSVAVRWSGVSHSYMRNVILANVESGKKGIVLEPILSTSPSKGSSYNTFDNVRIEVNGTGIAFELRGETTAGSQGTTCEHNTLSLDIDTGASGSIGLKMVGDVTKNTILRLNDDGIGTILLTEDGVADPNNNLFVYLKGVVSLSAGSYNFRALHWDSEGGGLTLGSGSQMHVMGLVDYDHGDVFVSPTYKTVEEKWIPAGWFMPGTGATFETVATHGQSIAFTEDVDEDATLSLMPYDWADGSILGVKAIWTAVVANNNWEYLVEAKAGASGDVMNASTTTKTGSVSVPSDANFTKWYETEILFGTPIAYTRGNLLNLRFERTGTESADDNTDEIRLIGIKLLYESDGPNSGTWDLTSPPYTT